MKMAMKRGHIHILNTEKELLMFFAHLFLAFAISASAQERVLSFPVTSDQLAEYIAKREREFAFYIRPEYAKHALMFAQQELAKKPKGWAICGQNIDTKAIKYSDKPIRKIR